MAHVDVARGIGEHLQQIILFLLRVFGDLEYLILLPELLPFFFYRVRSIYLVHSLSLSFYQTIYIYYNIKRNTPSPLAGEGWGEGT